MFDSTVINVAIGMIFIYLLLSLMCSAANEMIELMLKKRAIDLERGIRELLEPGTDSGTEGIVQKLYDHALINNLFGGTYEESRIGNPLRRIFRTQLPSYIPARNFALALMDLVALPPDATEGARPTKPKTPPPVAATAAPPADRQAAVARADASMATPKPPSGAAGATVSSRAPVSAAQFVVNVPPSGGSGAPPPMIPLATDSAPPPPGADQNLLTPLRQAIERNPILEDVTRRSLITLLDAAGGDVAKARENIENWFNSSMDRVSGWYKRRAQLTILVVGLFVAIAVNVDTIAVAKRLSTDDGLRDSLVAAADAYAKANASPSATPEPTETPAPTLTPTSTPTPPSVGSAEPLASGSSTSRPGSSPTPLPTPTPLPECVKDPTSDECKRAKINQACEDPDSYKCQTAKACSEPDSVECRRATALEKACANGDSAKCKYLGNEQQLRGLGLPIGWDSPDDPKRRWPGLHLRAPGGWLDQIYWHWLGWLLTALAISLGAPFWFDLLNKFIVIRSAVKPHEKSPEEESKD